MQNINN
jgi:hypothetical protein